MRPDICLTEPSSLVPWPHCVQAMVVVAGGVALAVAAGAAMEIACSMTLRQEVENHRSRGRNLRLYEATPFSLELRHERFRQGAGRFRALLCDLRRKTDALIEWHVPRGP